MKHLVITRSAYGPEWDFDANARRLEITQAVTAAMMRRQTSRDWSWVVVLDARDPLLNERMAVYEAAAPSFVPIIWTPPYPLATRSKAADYMPEWQFLLSLGLVPTLQTRLDDDDALASNAIARLQDAACTLTARTILMLPHGYRVWAGCYIDEWRPSNAMQTLFTPPGDSLCVYDYGHHDATAWAPVVIVDEAPGWLWVRHRDTISVERAGSTPIPGSVRKLFPIDWHALESAWAS